MRFETGESFHVHNSENEFEAVSPYSTSENEIEHDEALRTYTSCELGIWPRLHQTETVYLCHRCKVKDFKSIEPKYD
jgi:hypothetical protein